VNWREGMRTTDRAGEQHQVTKARTWRDTTSGFSGAPLDAVKVASACLMLADHVNYVFFGHVANFMWYLGRPVFPLFVFAMVCNLIRGTDALEYVGKLILLGVFSQPFYATLMATDQGNTLFTLAVGAVLVVALRAQRPVVQHLVFFIAIIAIFSSLFRVRGGLDFGLGGMLFPAALYLVLQGRLWHLPSLALLLFALNWYPIDNPWRLEPVQVALFACASATVIALAALRLRKQPRFLPRYALHIFYPGHLLALLAIHLWL
jgi:TraX protein